MKSKFLFLAMILCLVMAGTSFAGANLVPNGSFEEAAGAEPDGWASWSTGGAAEGAGYVYVTDAADAADGVDYMALTSGVPGTAFQMYFHHDIPVTVGTEYFLSVMAKKPVGGADAQFEIKMEFYETPGGSVTGGYREDAQAGPFTVSSETWEQYTVSGFPHSTATVMTVNAVALGGQVATVHVDNYIVDTSPIGLAPKATNGSPIGAANPDTLSALTWDNALLAEVDAYLENTDTDVIEVEVYFDTNEAMVAEKNILSQVLPRGVRSSITTDDVEWATLDNGSPIGTDVYYWLVESFAVDTDALPSPTAVTLPGDVWKFATTNETPIVDAGPSHNLWVSDIPNLPSRKITTAPVVSDDGIPGPLDYTWTCVPAAFSIADDKSEVTEITFLNVSEVYTVTLTVDDGDADPLKGIASDSFTVIVVANTDDALAAHWRLDDSGGSEALDDLGVNDGVGTSEDELTIPTAPAAGKVGTSFAFDSTLTQYVDIPGSGYMTDPNNIGTWADNLSKGLTVSYWMKSTATDGSGGDDWAGLVSRDNASWEMVRNGNDNNGSINFSCQNGVGNANTMANDITTNAFDGQWHNIVGTYDGANIKVYIDGLLADSVAANANNAGAMELSAGAANISIGRTCNLDGDNGGAPALADDQLELPSDPSAWGKSYFAGSIDQVRILSAALPERSPRTGMNGVVETYRVEGGMVNCGGIYTAEDLNQNCYNDLGDFALIALEWLECSDIANALCD